MYANAQHLLEKCDNVNGNHEGMQVRKTKGHRVVHDARDFSSGKNKKTVAMRRRHRVQNGLR